MEKFNINILLSQVGRLPADKVRDLIDKHQNDLCKLSIVDANQILNYVDKKFQIVSQWHNSNGMVDIMTFKMIATKIPKLSRYTFEEIDNFNKLNPMIQVEVAHLFSENERLNLINNFGDKLNSSAIQNLILALSDENQKRMIIKYKNKILDSNSTLFLTFIGTLSINIQKYLLQAIKANINSEMVSSIIMSLHIENIDFFFNEYHDKIESFDENEFMKILTMLSGDSVISFSKHFKSKIKDLPADLLMYRLGMNIDDPLQVYNFWKSNKEKLNELPNTYFNLIISRLDDNSRLASLLDFKEKYNALDSEELLNLFEFDSDDLKIKLFIEYKNKLSDLDSKIFIDYVNENIETSILRNKIFLLYKDYLFNLTDEEFIYFIETYSEKKLKYSWQENKGTTKEELVNFIINNFKDRLQSFESEFVPKLFSSCDTCLQHEFLTILKQNIENLIIDKTYIESLLRSTWGKSKEEIFTLFYEQFKCLDAKDWYGLLNVIISNDYSIIEPLLLSCNIENFDFIDKEKLLSDNAAKRMFYYFEKNIQGKMLEKYNALAENNEIDKLMSIYEDLMTKIVDSDPENILTDYNSINLLVLCRVLLNHNIITDKDDFYQMFKELYMTKLLKNLDKENPENINLIKDSLFYRLVKGSINPTMLLSITTLKGLIFFNKNSINLDNKKDINIYVPSEVERFVDNLTEEQVIGLNNKLFKQLCKNLFDNYKDEYLERNSVRNLAIRLYLSVGFSNAKSLINLQVPFTRYEYIFNGINIKNIKLNDNGEPIINKKLNDFMFGSSIEDNNTNINKLLKDKVPEFERRFADIYNGWDTIYQNLNGNVTLTRILKWFEENKILLNPDEYKLAPILNELGSDETNLQKARSLYNDMRNRQYSTIPKVIGNYNDEYTYEILDLADPLGLAVGYITRCCFLIDGASSSSLFHSAQSKDGRIFVVRKNGELVAQSWVWRNGNLVCFDNVETRGNYDSNILLKVYQKASQNIIDISNKEETTKEQIKLVTFGAGYSKMDKPKEVVPREEIKTPRVDEYIYSDAKIQQYILASNGEKELYYGDVQVQYKDKRKMPERYTNLSLLSRDERSSIAKKIKAIDFIKNECTRIIDFDNYQFISIADDWYILITNTGNVECILLDNDSRAKKEIYDELDKLETTFSSMGIYQDSKQISSKVLSLVKRGE